MFDAPFFSINTKEATGMSPQQRWALEAAYHAFENAGIPMESLSGSRTAVFSTYMMDDFMTMSMRDPDQLPQQAAIGLAPMIIPNRVSWFFNLKGPSVLVETGCSSAMVAIDMACNAMRSGDADMVRLNIPLSRILPALSRLPIDLLAISRLCPFVHCISRDETRDTANIQGV